MPTSIIIAEKGMLELSVEIDKDVRLSMGTGFHDKNGESVNVEFPVTIDELKDMHRYLGELIDHLKTSWKCSSCGSINHGDMPKCPMCDTVK